MTAQVDGALVTLFLVSVSLKLLLLPSYTSTDFEVHRNWLSVTYHLPRHRWYHEATSEWTLDYPPFFAYFEYFMSLIAAHVDKAMLVISRTPIHSTSVVLFQRLTVITSDGVLFYAVHAYCSARSSKHTETKGAFSRTQRLAILILTVLDAGLLYVDHIHFQYNGMLTGLLIFSATKIRQQQDLQGALVYTVLLMLKHIYLYAAPLYFTYLLRHYCYIPKPKSVDTDKLRSKAISSTGANGTTRTMPINDQRFSFRKLVQLGALVLGLVAFAFGSILWNHENPIAGLQQILTRLFPVQRGLCHAYWAPNVWALYAFLDKVLVILRVPASKEGVALMSGGLVQEAKFAILPTVSPLVCAVLTFAMMMPVLRSIWKYPDSTLFTSALLYCMLCSFLLGYHVHEKAILQVTLPMALVATDSVASMRLYRMASGVAIISLFPLLFTPAEQGTKVLLGACHALLAKIVLVPLFKRSRKEQSSQVGLSIFERVYLAALVGLAMLAAVFPYLPRIGSRYPFLPLMLISVSCATGNMYVWGLTITQYFVQVAAVNSAHRKVTHKEPHTSIR